jgi:hypothetical protein
MLIAGSNPKSAFAVRTPIPPKIDGKLNEPEWQLAKPETTFTQYAPIEGADPNEKTEIRFLYDNEALYVGCRMYDSDPSKIVARLARRDDEVESDYISFRIDSYSDNQTNFEFTVSAAGVRTDILEYDDGTKLDPSWDVVWDAKTSIEEGGWVAEVKIPFQALRFIPREEHDWGLQILRIVSRTQEHLYWVLIRKSENGWTSKFGHLKGIGNIPTSTNLELLPYVVGKGKSLPLSVSNPDHRKLSANAGLDIKYRPSVSLTVDATLNPDFGQVEADPAVLNLTTFQTFYPEKRPFFIEGSQIIHFSTFGDDFGPGLFYSRRIGRPINVVPPVGGYIQNGPDFATILGAAKISGKTQDGLSIGVLEAVTRQEKATFVDSTGNKSDQVVEPLSNFSLLRLKKDVLENSNIGLIATNVSRDGRLPALTGGVDWNLRFLESIYRVDGFLALSHTTHADPIAQVSNGEYLTGPAGRINVRKEGGTHWRWSLGYDFTSKGFNINDMGYFRRPNDHGTVDEVVYREDVPTEHILWWRVGGTYHFRNNYDGAELFNSLTLNADVELLNYWEFKLQATSDWGKFDDRETRGNGLYRKPTARSFQFQVTTDPRIPVVGGIQFGAGNDDRKSNTWNMAAILEVKPASNISLLFSLIHSEVYRFFAWVTNRTSIDDPTLPSKVTSSIFAERTVSQWDLTTRGSFVFTQDLSLQYYLQVFFAKGKFENTRRMATRDTFEPYEFNPPSSNNPNDFTELSMNSNIVLRWEYMPGSTAYLVWSQARSGSAGYYATPFADNVSNTLGLPPTNVLLLKISYWLSY